MSKPCCRRCGSRRNLRLWGQGGFGIVCTFCIAKQKRLAMERQMRRLAGRTLP
jgi:hypothetical protein